MRIGIVCPYSFDTPGGVQFHVRDLAEILIRKGHYVSVLAPADPKQILPDYVTSVGRALPVKYNGSVARLAFGPRVARVTQQWLDDGEFDVVHIHEPFVPSCSLIALRSADVPVVATFHSNQEQSRVLAMIEPLTRPGFERISARIAVSSEAEQTIIQHFDTNAVVIPNGVYVDRFRHASPNPAWQGSKDAPTIAFLGRVEEPRKGLPVLLDAVPQIVKRFPGARFLIAGNGEFTYDGPHADAIERLGPISDVDKAALLSSVDVYVAPQTGGESFGIVLVEAMSAGASILASDLVSFTEVLAGGKAGFLFENGDSGDLADTLITMLTDHKEKEVRRAFADRWVRRFDWETVASEIFEVYRMVTHPVEPFAVQLTSRRARMRRFFGRSR